MTKKQIENEYGDCAREQMLAYLTKVHELQKKAAGKMTVDQFVKDFDKEWNRRRENYIKRHGKDCV